MSQLIDRELAAALQDECVALENVFAEAMQARDTDAFFEQAERGVRAIARDDALPGTRLEALLHQLAAELRRYQDEGFDELEALAELTDRFAGEGLAEAAPIVGGVAARALAAPLARRGGAPLPRPLRQQLVRSGRQAARALARRQGPQALRALPAIVRQTQRVAVAQRLPGQALPATIQKIALQVANQPGRIQRSAQSVQLPPVPAYTQCDFIDPRIDVSAQYALYRMLGDPTTRQVAAQMLAAVKSEKLGGIYQEDQLVPAQRAEKLGLGWWGPLISTYRKSAELAACVPPVPATLDASPVPVLLPKPSQKDKLPIIAFRKSLGSHIAQLGQELRKVWQDCGIPYLQYIAPSGKPCPRKQAPPPPNRKGYDPNIDLLRRACEGRFQRCMQANDELYNTRMAVVCATADDFEACHRNELQGLVLGQEACAAQRQGCLDSIASLPGVEVPWTGGG